MPEPNAPAEDASDRAPGDRSPKRVHWVNRVAGRVWAVATKRHSYRALLVLYAIFLVAIADAVFTYLPLLIAPSQAAAVPEAARSKLLPGIVGRPARSSSNAKLSSPTPITEGAPAMIELTSTAFSHGEPIPKKYTGEGVDVSPPLNWKNVPEGTKELAVICSDPDAPTDEPWIHWVLYKVPATESGLPEGIPRELRLKKPAGAMQGKNSWPSGNIGYRGPMPPPGHGTHHYHFAVFALPVSLVVEPGVDVKVLAQEIQNHVIGEGSLIGTYER